MAPRGPLRTHKKSRSGCTTCRARRIKCDETQPECNNCSKRSVLCVYQGKPLAPTGRKPIGTLSSVPSQTVDLARLLVPLGHSLPGVELDLLHLSLLHQWSTSTYASFSSNSSAQTVWREYVPRTAFSYPPVLHGVFAISALHLSFLNPSKTQYQLVAASHYQQASLSLRQALTDVDNQELERSRALFLACSLITLYVFADFNMCSAGSPGALTWIPILRGVYAVVGQNWGSLSQSSLAPIFKIKAQAALDAPSVTPCSKPALQLPDDIDTLHLTEPDPAEAAIYEEALQKLRWSYDLSKDPDYRLASTFIWPAIVSDEFLDLLRAKRPRALALLACYYCAMFPTLEGVWWNTRTPKEDLKIIEGMVGAEDETWARLLREAGRLWENDV